jgi:hypothetical protein
VPDSPGSPDARDQYPERSLWLREADRLLRIILVVASLTGAGGAIYSTARIDDNVHDVARIEELNQDDDEKIAILATRIDQLTAHHHHEPEPGPAGPCICVDESPPGPQFRAFSCSLMPECSPEAIAHCEKAFPGTKCKPLF